MALLSNAPVLSPTVCLIRSGLFTILLLLFIYFFLNFKFYSQYLFLCSQNIFKSRASSLLELCLNITRIYSKQFQVYWFSPKHFMVILKIF